MFLLFLKRKRERVAIRAGRILLEQRGSFCLLVVFVLLVFLPLVLITSCAGIVRHDVKTVRPS